jgi:hypothetical protein
MKIEENIPEITFDIENEIVEIINTTDVNKLNDALLKYHPKYILQVVVSSDVMDENKIVHILKTYRNEYTDSWLMSECMIDLETYILKAMYEMGVDVHAKFTWNNNYVSLLDVLLNVEKHPCKSTFIILESIDYLKSIL